MMGPLASLSPSPVHAAGFINVALRWSPNGPTINQTVTFNGNWTGGSGPFTYTLGFGDGTLNSTGTVATAGNMGTIGPITHSYSSAGPFAIGLTVTDNLAQNKGTSKQLGFSIRGYLVTDFTFSPSTPNFGDNVSFTATISNGTRSLAGTYNFTLGWNFGDGTLSTVKFSASSVPATRVTSHRVHASAMVVFHLTVTDSFGQSSGLVSNSVMMGGLLGIDCGYGSIQAVMNATGYPGPDGTDNTGKALLPTLDRNCDWAGSPDIPFGGTQLQPLVTDNPTQTLGPSCCSSPTKGGGFTADIPYVQGGPDSNVGSFDVTVSWDPKILSAVEFDQGGLVWSGGNAFTATNTIDNSVGNAELSQALIVSPSTVSGNLTLFRIRFDVVGIGKTGLTVSGTVGGSTHVSLPHATIQSNFNSTVIPDIIATTTLGYSASWTLSPNPALPGSPTSFVATASCPGCTAPFTYQWSFNSTQGYPDTTCLPACSQAVEATGQSVSVTLPGSNFAGHRVTLIVTDAAGHVAEATRRLPLSVPKVTSPATLPVGTAGSLTAQWLGGLPPYSGTTGAVGVKWVLCNSTPVPQGICSNPIPSTSTTSAQAQTISNTYRFSGLYTESVTVTDTTATQIPVTTIYPGNQAVASTTFQVNVTGSPSAYTVAITTNATSAPLAGETLSVTATIAYDANYPPAAQSSQFKITFMFGDGTTKTLPSSGKIANVNHLFGSSATYPIIVIAQELSSNSLAKIQETGFYFPPLAGTISPSNSSPGIGETVTFTAAGAGGMPPYTYSWNFGDGTTATGSSPTHSYNSAGTYTVTLTVTDAAGRTTTSTQSVVVGAGGGGLPLYLIIGAGVAAAAVAIGALLFIRSRRRPVTVTIGRPTTSSPPKRNSSYPNGVLSFSQSSR